MTSFLLSPTSKLPGVGTKTHEQLARLSCTKVIDLLYHLPSDIIVKRRLSSLAEAKHGEYIIAEVEVLDVQDRAVKFDRKQPIRIYCGDGNAVLSVVYFNYYPDYLLRSLRISNKMIISGKVEKWGNELQICHPDSFGLVSAAQVPLAIDVIYPLTYGLVSRQLHKMITKILEKLEQVPEWLDLEMMTNKKWPSFTQALCQAHNPKSLNELSPFSLARMRLAYDELLANQLSLKLFRYKRVKTIGQVILPAYSMQKQLLDHLSFALTQGQIHAISEIEADQQTGKRMMRLLQGDVGCGKTLVAFIAQLNVVASAKQAVLMAPTDILANQIYQWICGVTTILPIKVALLTGKISGKKRVELLEGVASGDYNIIIGTHALFQKDVVFKDLGLIVIDEQHRFGVEQRKALAAKNDQADMLIMSATPIPRTLTMAIYGDMDLSLIKDKPSGRLPIVTSIIPMSKMPGLVASLAKQIEAGHKIYWICPLVEEQEEADEDKFRLDLTAAKTRLEEFEKLFPGKVGLVHGKMKQADKDAAMQRFISGEINLLVATTVIEVGVDVKDASVIIIEQAERFGLSQLHQLRGRVGRGNIQSYCILLYQRPLSKLAAARLKIIRETEDGFIIAENDLKLRGEGEVLGVKQSGAVNFKIANLELHGALFEQAAHDAKNIMNQDPGLTSPRGVQLRFLLELQGYTEQLANLPS